MCIFKSSDVFLRGETKSRRKFQSKVIEISTPGSTIQEKQIKQCYDQAIQNLRHKAIIRLQKDTT